MTSLGYSVAMVIIVPFYFVVFKCMHISSGYLAVYQDKAYYYQTEVKLEVSCCVLLAE